MSEAKLLELEDCDTRLKTVIWAITSAALALSGCKRDKDYEGIEYWTENIIAGQQEIIRNYGQTSSQEKLDNSKDGE